MAVYHLCLKIQLSNEWLKRCTAFYNKLQECGCKKLPDCTFEVDETDLESIANLATQYGIEATFIKR